MIISFFILYHITYSFRKAVIFSIVTSCHFSVKHLIFHPLKKTFASHIITRRSFFGHASCESILFHSFDSFRPTIIHTTIIQIIFFVNLDVSHTISTLFGSVCRYAPSRYFSDKTINNR